MNSKIAEFKLSDQFGWDELFLIEPKTGLPEDLDATDDFKREDALYVQTTIAWTRRSHQKAEIWRASEIRDQSCRTCFRPRRRRKRERERERGRGASYPPQSWMIRDAATAYHRG